VVGAVPVFRTETCAWNPPGHWPVIAYVAVHLVPDGGADEGGADEGGADEGGSDGSWPFDVV
jgi:hypothetical protein